LKAKATDGVLGLLTRRRWEDKGGSQAQQMENKKQNEEMGGDDQPRWEEADEDDVKMEPKKKH
jgi:hypothetical protein